MKYAVVSDIHANAWSTFGHTESDGVNNRLRIILNELERAGDHLKAAGGNVLVMAGDLFHTRGVMDPEVLNPVRKTIARLLDNGIYVYAIPGNHDLKSRDTTELSSAVQNLEQVGVNGGFFTVLNEPSIRPNGMGGFFAFVPWRYTHEELLVDLQWIQDEQGILIADTDVFIHAGIDGVLSGVPAGGLTDGMLASFGFRRVFAGHYHNHKDFGNGVVSIGATTHHNWGDVGTRAGFLLVDGDTGAVTFNDTNAPKFVDISGMDEFEMAVSAPGNYVRFRGAPMTNDQVNELRKELGKLGALGVSIECPRTTAVTRTTAPIKGVSTRESIANFVKAADVSPGLTREEVEKRALEVFDRSQAVIEEA